jgi:hypothetical protein
MVIRPTESEENIFSCCNLFICTTRKFFFTYAIYTNYHNHVRGKLGRVYDSIIGIGLASIYDTLGCLFYACPSFI